MTVQDWGVTYEELEPHYDKFEYLCGIAGKAGNLQGPDPGRRQSVRGPARARVSEPAACDMTYAPDPVRPGGAGARLPPVPAPVRQHVAALYQSARRAARALHLLRLLREIRLRQLFQGERRRPRSAGADAQAQFRAAHRMRGDARSISTARRKRATGVTYIDAQGEEFEQPAELVVLSAYRPAQRAAAAAVGDRHALRSGDRPGRGRQELRLPDHVERSTCSSTTSILNPFIGAGALGIGRSTTSTATTSTMRARFHRRRLHRLLDHQRPPDRDRPAARRARRSGAANGRQAVAKNYLTSHVHLDPRCGHEPPRQLSRSRSDLSGRLRPAAACA